MGRTTEVLSTPPAGVLGRAGGWLGGRPGAIAVTLVGVALPTLRMAGWVRAGSRTQHLDYWPMLDDVVRDDGAIRWAGLLEAQTGHPVMVPKLLYLANVLATDGSNRALGLLVIALGLGLVALVGMLARATPGLGRWGRVGIVVAAAFLVMAPAGGWSFIRAMSGTAWLTANLFTVAALVAQQRRWRAATVVLGVLATISYGTGVMVWPALVVAGLLRDRRQWRAQWHVWVVGAIALAVFLRWRLTTPLESGSSAPIEALQRAASIVLEPILPDEPALAVVVGVVVAIGAGASVVACRSRLAAAAPWIAIVVFAVGAALMIGRARPADAMAPGGDAVPSRYWSVSAWVWIGLLGLAVLALRGRPWRLLLPVVLVLGTLVEGTGPIDDLEPSTMTQDLLAAAMVMGVADGNHIGGGGQPFPPMTDDLRAVGHHPFDGSFDLGCGLLGDQVEVEPGLPDRGDGKVEVDTLEGTEGVVGFGGWVSVPGGHIECVVVADAEGRVVGLGTTRAGHGRRRRLRAIAPADLQLTVAVRTEPGGLLWTVPEAG